MTRKAIDKILYFPAKIFFSFLFFTEILFFIGPLEYEITNSILLVSYLILMNLSLLYGYSVGVNKFRILSNSNLFISTEKILILSLIVQIYSLIIMLNSRGVSLGSIPQYLIFSVFNPGDAYYAEIQETSDTSYILLLFKIIVCPAIPVGVYEWNGLKTRNKIILVLIISLTLIYWVCIGTRKGILDVLLICFMFYIVRKKDIIIDAKNRRKVIAMFAIPFAMFLSYFLISNASRYEYFDASNDVDKSLIREWYIQYVPDSFTQSLCNIQSYLCQGYYALSKSFEIGIISPVPMSSSWFSIAIAKKIGYDPTPDTYTGILEQTAGIDMAVNWHSIYVWIANSVSFLGVPFVVFAIGLFFGITWKDSIIGRSTVAMPLFSLMLIMVFYFFANNQVLSFDFLPFVFWLIYYIYKRTFRCA